MAKAKSTKAPKNAKKKQTQRPGSREPEIAPRPDPKREPDGLVLIGVAGSFIAVLVTLVGAIYGNLNTPTELQPRKPINTVPAIKKRALAAECDDRADPDQCAEMAFRGGCNTAPGWMSVMCAASCGVCELLDVDVRCNAERLNLTMKPAFEIGELDQLFLNLPERYPEYNVTYLSKPPTGPFVVQFDNFLTDHEVDAMIDNVGNLRRSTDQGKFDEAGVQEQVVSNTRTSENAWCMGACESVAEIKAVKKRISEITTVDEDNFENFQMLRYENGQEYKRHHDMSESSLKQLAGPRVLTFFLYLSDVEEGGETAFTDLKPPILMPPKKGSAILWASVLSDDLTKQDPLTFHQARPVIKGTKYAANTWIHQYNFKVPNLHGCTGAFS